MKSKTTEGKGIKKTKYLKITDKDLVGNYEVDINMDGTVKL